MNLTEKFNDIYKIYNDSIPESESTENYVDLLGTKNVFGPSYEYDYVNRQLRFNKNKKIAGYKISDFNSIEDLYNLKEASCVLNHMKAVTKSFNLLKEKDHKSNEVLSFKMESYLSFKGKNGKRFTYKRIAIDTGRKNGQITNTATFLEEITDAAPQILTKASIILNWEDQYELEIPEVNKFKKLLSPREIEILTLITKGFTSFDIARGLRTSVHTVRTQRRNMIKKLDVSNSVELVDLARNLNLF